MNDNQIQDRLLRVREDLSDSVDGLLARRLNWTSEFRESWDRCNHVHPFLV